MHIHAVKEEKMETITLKPHHFMDILKLYGTGIQEFTPDESLGHDFHQVANTLIQNLNQTIRVTLQMDSICIPCKKCVDQKCADQLTHIEGFTSKETYNQLIDARFIELLNLDLDYIFTAKELAQLMLDHHLSIFEIWQERPLVHTIQRHDNFILGATRYLNQN